MTTQATLQPQAPIKKDNDVILRTSGLTKHFGTLVAVNNLNLELRRGEVFGFLGPNGAGKSTTVGMILGLIAPTSGSIELFGKKLDGHNWPLMRRVGAIIEEPAFYPYLSGRDNLETLSRSIGGIPKTKIDEVLKRVNLFDRAGDRYDHYSMGMKQRLGIASTLLRDPELIILDEPTSGLDPAGTKEVRDLIPQLAHENCAVFLCSHLLHEVELVCNRVAIIQQGVIVANSTVKELLNQGNLLQIKVDNVQKATDFLKSLPWINSVVIKNDYLTENEDLTEKDVLTEYDYLVVDAPKDSASRVNKALVENGILVSELVKRTVSLEDVFLQLTGGDSGD